MTRDKAQAAVDDAFGDHVHKIFAVLVANIIVSDGSGDAAAKAFSKGLAAADEAHSIASGIVDKTFAE